MKKTKFMPLRTLPDGINWTEKAINEADETNASIARCNARIGCVKALKSLYDLALSYAKLRRQGGGRIKELETFAVLQQVAALPADEKTV